MARSQLLERLALRIAGFIHPHPLRVAIDGVDAAGKTTFADELTSYLAGLNRMIIRASVDGFHNPSVVRYRQGRLSPVGYYEDSFDYAALCTRLLIPLGPGGNREYKTAVFDYRTDNQLVNSHQVAAKNAILLLDGIFLHRPELVGYWDYSIFLDVRFEISIARAIQRNAERVDSDNELRKQYHQRYIPGQRLYLDAHHPAEKANMVIDNSDLANPTIVAARL